MYVVGGVLNLWLGNCYKMLRFIRPAPERLPPKSSNGFWTRLYALFLVFGPKTYNWVR